MYTSVNPAVICLAEFSMVWWQVVTKASGGFSDDIASSMHHAGVVVAVDAGMPSAQAIDHRHFSDFSVTLV